MGNHRKVWAAALATFLVGCPPAQVTADGGADAGPSALPDGSCVSGLACVPDSVCHVGVVACGIIDQCVDLGAPRPVGTPCGAGFACLPDGNCSGRLTLSVVSGGGQRVYPLQRVPEPFVVELTDQTGAPTAGERIDFVAPPGMVISNAAAVTDAQGRASVRARLGLADYLPLVATGPMNTRVTLPITVDLIPEEMVFDLVGEDRSEGHDGDELLGPEARVGEVRGLARVGLSTYFADDCAVRVVDFRGFVHAIAGTATCGDSGDGQAPLAARLNRPTGLVSDNQLLYVADTRNHRIRVINFTTNVISTFAGGGDPMAANWDDGLTALQANFSDPGWLGLTPSRDALLVADTGHDRVRRIELASGLVSTVLAGQADCSGEVGFLGCGGELGCHFSWTLEVENVIPRPYLLLVSGQLCGARTGGPVPGLISLLGRGIDHVGGHVDAGAGLVQEVRRLRFGSPPLQATTGPRMVILADGAGHRVWSAEPTTGHLTPVLGDGTASSTGNYLPALMATAGRPTGLLVDYRTAFIADGDGHAIRSVTVPLLRPRDVAVALQSAGAESVVQMQPALQPFVASARVAGVPLAGVTLDWEATTGRCSAAPSSLSDDAGLASLDGVRVGLASCELAASFRRLFPPLRQAGFRKSVTALPTGLIATFVNEQGAAAAGPLPEFGPFATLEAPTAMAGSFFVSGCAIRQLDSNGWVTTFAGDPSRCGFGGDGGPASAATFSRAGGLALDGSALYVADTGNDRVRRIDLVSGVVSTIVGGGSGAPANDGDGAAATAAVLSQPGHVLFGGGTTLYVADNGHNRIRVVDAGTISAFLSPSTCNGRAIAFQGCATARSCSLAGSVLNVFVAGTICGTGPGGITSGIVRAGIGLTHIAGRVGGATADGTLGPQLAMPSEVHIGYSTDLYFSEPANHRVRRLATTGSLVTTVAGTGVAGFSGDSGLATMARLSSPGALTFRSRAILVSDTGNNAVRAIGF